jgi:putative NADPH-quinone reductase
MMICLVPYRSEKTDRSSWGMHHPLPKRIFLIQGHPDPVQSHLSHALAACYEEGAQNAGHTVRHCDVGKLDFPMLRSQQEFESCELPEHLQKVQADIFWSEHLVLFFPLWAGGMPALLHGFLEQIFRPSFTGASAGIFTKKRLNGHTARLVVSMGMPTSIYRWYFCAHGIKSLQRSLLGIVGIGPVKSTLIGRTANMKRKEVDLWFSKVKHLGARGE